MGYNTTGQSHKNGNKGEKQVEGFFRLKKGRCFGLDEEYGEFIEIQQLGGTQNKDDSRALYARGALGISTAVASPTTSCSNVLSDVSKGLIITPAL